MAEPDLIWFRGRGDRIRFGSGIQEPDSVRFLRPETGFGSVWPDCISGWRLHPASAWLLVVYWFNLLVVALASRVPYFYHHHDPEAQAVALNLNPHPDPLS